jgi:hypothetical protein
MVYKGHILENGLVELEGKPSLPVGTEVKVEVASQVHPDVLKLRETLLKHAGTVEGLPPDAAYNLDHYLHGHPKKEAL